MSEVPSRSPKGRKSFARRFRFLKRWKFWLTTAIVLALIFPYIQSALYHLRARYVFPKMQHVAEQLKAYEAAEGYYPPDLQTLVDADYLGSLPWDPWDPDWGPLRYINYNDEIVALYSVSFDRKDQFTHWDWEMFVEATDHSDYFEWQHAKTLHEDDNAMPLYAEAVMKYKESAQKRSLALHSEIDVPSRQVQSKMWLVRAFGWEEAEEIIHAFQDSGNIPETDYMDFHGQRIERILEPLTPSLEDLHSRLTEDEPLHELIRLGAERSRLEGSPEGTPMMFEDDIRTTQAVELLGYFQCAAAYKAAQGDTEGALNDYLAALRFTLVFDQARTAEGKLDQFNNTGRILRLLQTLMTINALGTNHYELIRDEGARYQEDELPFDAHIHREIVAAEWHVESFDGPYISYSGIYRHWIMNLFAPLPQPTVVQDAIDSAEVLAEEYVKPYWQVPANVPEISSNIGLTYLVAYSNNAPARIARHQAWLEATKIIAGLRHHRSANGRYPETLSVIEGFFGVDGIPADPFTGNSFGYRATDDGFLLWSFGPDMDDDNGDKTVENWDFESPDGDLVFGTKRQEVVFVEP